MPAEPPPAARRAAVAVTTAAAAMLLTAGCASESPPATGGTTGATATSATATTATASTSSRPGTPAATGPPPSQHQAGAVALAARIPGCRPQPLTPPTAARRLRLTATRDIATAAACTLRGRTAIILTVTTRAQQVAIEAQLRHRVAYYATGPGWSAAPTDTSEPIGQQSVVQDVALALRGRIQTGVG